MKTFLFAFCWNARKDAVVTASKSFLSLILSPSSEKRALHFVCGKVVSALSSKPRGGARRINLATPFRVKLRAHERQQKTVVALKPTTLTQIVLLRR
jgi:hypothetical protein